MVEESDYIELVSDYESVSRREMLFDELVEEYRRSIIIHNQDKQIALDESGLSFSKDAKRPNKPLPQLPLPEFSGHVVSKYIRRMDKQLLQTEGVFQLCKSQAKHMPEPDVSTRHFSHLLHQFIRHSQVSQRELARQLTLFIDSLCDQPIGNNDHNKHRGICQLLLVIFDCLYAKCEGHYSWNYFGGKVFQYLNSLIEHYQHLNTDIWAIIAIERLPLTERSNEQNEKLIENLRKLDNHCEWRSVLNANCRPEHCQVALCAQWLLRNTVSGSLDQEIRVKLSQDGFSARSDEFDGFVTVRSLFGVLNGTYFFEVLLITDQQVSIGWSTNQSELSIKNAIGSDKHSIGFDVRNGSLWHGGISNKVIGWKPAKVGDVVGCLVDVTNRKFDFYLNGMKMCHAMSGYFSTIAYYASVSLGPHQQCYCNFGQAPFRYASSLDAVSDFHHACDAQLERYRLAAPRLAGMSFWFKEHWQDGHESAELFFLDNRQHQFHRWVIEATNEISRCTKRSILYEQSSTYIRLNQEIVGMKRYHDGESLRLIQALIRECKPKLKYLILCAKYFRYILPLFEHPTPAMLLQLLHPYMQLHAKCQCDLRHTELRNVCMVLSILVRRILEPERVVLFTVEMVEFFERMFTGSDHGQNLLLFAVIALEGFASVPENLDRIRANGKLIKKLTTLAHNMNKFCLKSFYIESLNSLEYQVAFCANWFLANELKMNSTCIGDYSEHKFKARLDPNDKTNLLKLSSDLLSARSDWRMQTVRASFPVTNGVFFYEVVLLTGGLMQIGWATKKAKFSLSAGVGDNKHSVGVDGSRGCVWHKAVQRPIKDAVRWNTGDVVGCLLDLCHQKFIFYLNGKELLSNFFVQFDTEPYFAAASLGQFQQCYFNFGQTPFAYPPAESVKPLNFHTVIDNYVKLSLCPFCYGGGSKWSFEKAQIRFGSCDHWTVCHQCALRFNGQCPSCGQ